jgi:putative transposase
MSGVAYHVTWRIRRDQAPLSPEERTQVVSALRHFDGERYLLFAFVVMDDHVHVILQPAEGWALEVLVHSWKSFLVSLWHKAGHRAGSVWQPEYYDRIIRSDAEMLETARYVVGNPVRRWPEVVGYEWVWPAEVD